MPLRLLALLASFWSVVSWLIVFCAMIGMAQVGLDRIGVAHAASFTTAVANDGKTVLLLEGAIERGDSTKLDVLVTALGNQNRTVSALFLDSPGGDGREHYAIAALVKRLKMSTFVADGAKCASACFTVFAAGHEKYAGSSARIGVHRVSAGRRETSFSFAATIEAAKKTGELGVPPGIIGKLVLTPPAQMAWLSPDDLRSMNVTITDTLRRPEAVGSADAAAVTPDGLKYPCSSAASPTDKDNPAGATTTFEGSRVNVIRRNPCMSNTDVWLGTDPLGTPHVTPEAGDRWERKRGIGEGR
ncbi:MAG: hypothetical protein K2Z80_01670 [Xanthobacteraceae bacterium]|nr:hypothetical protein [Xanthobacteraceae bacterium]